MEVHVCISNTLEAEEDGSGVQGYPVTQGIKGQAVLLLEILCQKTEANNLRLCQSHITVIKRLCLQNKTPYVQCRL